MSVQALQGIPRKAPGTTRIIICEEVFDYKRGGDQIAVLHPLSKLSFAAPAPEISREGTRQRIAAADYLAIKKAIWNRFTDLRQKAKQQTLEL